jgi:hypothetical protein
MFECAGALTNDGLYRKLLWGDSVVSNLVARHPSAKPWQILKDF